MLLAVRIKINRFTKYKFVNCYLKFFSNSRMYRENSVLCQNTRNLAFYKKVDEKLAKYSFMRTAITSLRAVSRVHTTRPNTGASK